MIGDRLGKPPDENSGGPPHHQEAHTDNTLTSTATPHHESSGRFHYASVADMARRRAAARRLPVLACGCRDPLAHRCTQPPLTDRQVDGYRDAALHLHALGLTPAPLLPELRALWQRGERRLVSEIAQQWELVR